jgi:hypothetical protein
MVYYVFFLRGLQGVLDYSPQHWVLAAKAGLGLIEVEMEAT